MTASPFTAYLRNLQPAPSRSRRTNTSVERRHRRPSARYSSSSSSIRRSARRILALVPTVVHGDFEWDEGKATSNVTKHGVSFEEAALAMKDPFSQDFDDGLQAANLVTLAALPSRRILYIVSTENDQRIRIISARDATRQERRLYEEAE
jgi:hypothetical protein